MVCLHVQKCTVKLPFNACFYLGKRVIIKFPCFVKRSTLMLKWKIFLGVMFQFLGENVSLGAKGSLPPLLLGELALHLGSGGELLDGTVVVLGGESLQGAPAVCMQLDDLHEERACQLGFGWTKHLVPDGC